MQKTTVVFGLGNPLMGDEGVGVEVLRRLSELSFQYPAAEFLDGGTGGMTLLYKMSGRRKAVFIDCCLMDTPPGAIRMFTPQDVVSLKRLSHFSLHEMDLLALIDLAARLGDGPREILIFGIEPAAIEQKESLSTVLAERLDEYVSVIALQLEAG
jgi:hydrogenase maturation protease